MIRSRTTAVRILRNRELRRVAMAGLAAGSILVPTLIAGLGLTGAVLVCAALLPLTVALAWTRLVALDARTPVPVQAIALLRKVALFGPLAAPGLEAIARRATWLTIEPGGS